MKNEQETVPEKISQELFRERFWEVMTNIWSRRTSLIASLAIAAVLRALAKRMPSLAHRKQGSEIADVALDAISVCGRNAGCLIRTIYVRWTAWLSKGTASKQPTNS